MRKKYKWIIFALFFIPSFIVAEEPQPDITTILMRSTFKIQCNNTIGTVFIMGEPSLDDPDKLFFVLITAAHVLEGMKSDMATLHLRKEERGKFTRLEYKVQIRKEGNPLWIRHPDVDVAAMRVMLPKDADVYLIPTTFIGNDKILEEFQVHPGDQLFVLGFPYGAEANEAGFPILRSGLIASYPLTPTERTKTFLLDFEVFSGNSGSPVLFYAENRKYGEGIHIGSIQFIMGVVSQEKELMERVESLSETVIRKHKLALAVVAHASFVADLIKMLPKIPQESP